MPETWNPNGAVGHVSNAEKKGKTACKKHYWRVGEFIYETTEKALQRVAAKGENISDMLYKAGDIEYVNIVMQNDEVSN